MSDLAPVEIIARHYIIAALWADAPEGTRPRASKQAQRAARKVAQQFLDACTAKGVLRPLIAAREDGYGAHPDCGTDKPHFAAAGHDLYLSQQGHGCGFFDRDTLSRSLRDTLQEIATDISSIAPVFNRGWMYLE